MAFLKFNLLVKFSSSLHNFRSYYKSSNSRVRNYFDTILKPCVNCLTSKEFMKVHNLQISCMVCKWEAKRKIQFALRHPVLHSRSIWNRDPISRYLDKMDSKWGLNCVDWCCWSFNGKTGQGARGEALIFGLHLWSIFRF